MGRKVHPMGFRLGVIEDWQAKWYAEGEEYSDLLIEDMAIRNLIREEMGHAGIPTIEIKRFPQQISIAVHTAKPGIIIGRRGSNVNALRRQLESLTKKRVRIDVQEVEQPELDAYLVAENIAAQIERRVSHRRAMKRAVDRAMQLGAEGIKIACKGRLFGAEMGRCEWAKEGRMPLQTLRADIDYAQSEALTTFGRIGVKVWIYKGDVMPTVPEEGKRAS